ncbi:MAG: response regulator transcription factor [Terracidiphilus sp.]|jgi:DNA-binding NarL/FixJ family response regulator
MTKGTLRILLIDDHAVVREGLRSALEIMGEMKCSEATSAEEALSQLRSGLRPDVVVMDFGLPGLDGLDAIGLIHAEQSKLPVLIFSMQPEEKLALRALEQGAAGYISKSSPNSEVVNAVRVVAEGKQYVSRQFAARLNGTMDRAQPAEAHEALSAREFETIRLIAVGKSLQEIAEALKISKATASTYRERLMMKLNLSNNYEIICYAIEKGLVNRG